MTLREKAPNSEGTLVDVGLDKVLLVPLTLYLSQVFFEHFVYKVYAWD